MFSLVGRFGSAGSLVLLASAPLFVIGLFLKCKEVDSEIDGNAERKDFQLGVMQPILDFGVSDT